MLDTLGRAFIRPPSIRKEVSKIKSNVIEHLVAGKIALVTEDSIVRGVNSDTNNDSLRRFGVKELHGKIGTPKLVSPCDWGIDVKNPDVFVARGRTEEEIARLTGYDSLSYTTVDELVGAIGMPASQLCLQCIGGGGPRFDYIIPVDDNRF